jgi:hypothetical protein
MKPGKFLEFLKKNDIAIALRMSREENITYDKAFYNLYHEVIFPLMETLGERIN